MGVSVYYSALRERPLTEQEADTIDAIVLSNETVGRPHYESFCVYDRSEPCEPNAIFEGATKLPLTTEDEFWNELLHLCRTLTLVRRILPDAEWDVRIDDLVVYWNAERQEYDPSVQVS